MRFPRLPDAYVSKIRPVVALVCCTIVAALFISLRHHIANVWHDATADPQQLVQLYFQDSTALPRQAKAGSTVSFSFATVANQSSDVPYIITVTTSSTTRAVSQGTIHATSGKASVVTQTVTLPADSDSATYFVTLPTQSETIHFQVKEMHS